LKFAAVAALAAVAVTLSAGAAQALPPTWVVRGHDATVVLFGSLNAMRPGVDWRSPELEDALAHSDQVWFEAPMDQASLAAASRTAAAHAYLPQGQTLESLLSPAGRVRLAQAGKLLGFSDSTVYRLQPWYAELMIRGMSFRQLGFNNAEAVEPQLWNQLPPTTRRVALETPEAQVDIFVEAPLADQVASLEQTLKDLPNARRDYEQLLQAWLAGDLRTLDAKVVEPLKKRSPTLYARLMIQQNASWARAIQARLQGKGRTLVVVSMGNLVGPDGLPAFLRAQGLEVEGPR
jgi:uncharacterized protein YbaP (TraB family)